MNLFVYLFFYWPKSKICYTVSKTYQFIHYLVKNVNLEKVLVVVEHDLSVLNGWHSPMLYRDTLIVFI